MPYESRVRFAISLNFLLDARSHIPRGVVSTCASDAFVISRHAVRRFEISPVTTGILGPLGPAGTPPSRGVLRRRAASALIIPRVSVRVPEVSPGHTRGLYQLGVACGRAPAGILRGGAVCAVVIFGFGVSVDEVGTGCALILSFLQVALIVFLVFVALAGELDRTLSSAECPSVGVSLSTGAPGAAFISASVIT